MTSNSNKKQKIAHCIPKRAICILCETNYEEELMVGKFFHHDEFSIHHFCMLLASGLEQKGQTDEDGIVGFLPEDIWIEVKRGRRLRCFFCKKTGATVGCCNKNCRKVFHVPCAYGRGVLHQFFDNFSSFCADHKPKQKISKKSSMLYSCPICLYSVNNQDVDNVILSPCCKNSLFHRQCIQMQALCAGYFFRCPICNNKEDFQNEMLTYGIYIPEQDAAWELEENAYQDLCFRYAQCDVSSCKCPKGRKYCKNDTLWEIMVCNICGSQGCHVGCGDVSIKMMYWECMECATVSSKVDERRSSLATPINTDVVEVESAHEVLNLETSPDKDTFGRKQQFPKEGVSTKKNKKKKKKKKKKSTSPTPTLVTLKKTKKKNSSSKDDNKLFPGKMEWTYGEVEQLKSFTTHAERTAEAQESSKVEKLPVTSSVQLARKKLAQESRRGNKRKRSHSRTEENSVLMCKKKKRTEPLGCKRSVIGNVGTLQDTSQTLKKKTWAFNEETLANCESSKAPLPKSSNSDNHISAHSTETSNNGCVIVKFKKSEMYFNNRLNNIESTTDNSNVEINHAKSLSIGNSKVDCTRAIETSVSQTNKTKNEETSVCRTNKTKNEKTSVCRTNKTKKKNNKDRSKFIGSDNKSSVENSNIIQTNIANTILSFKVPKKNKLLERSSVLSLQNVPCGTFNPSYSSEMKINPSVNIKSIEHIPISCKKNFSALINHEMSSLDILNQLEFKIRDSSTVGQKDSCILEVFRKENKKTGPSVKVGCYTIPLHSNCKDRCKDNNTSKKKRLLSEEQAITLMVPENRDCQLKMPQTARKSFPRTRVSFPIKLSHQKAKPKETLTYEDFIKQITRVSSSSVKEISRVKTPKSVTKSSFKKKDTCTKSKSSQIVDVSVVRKHGRKSVKKSSSNKKHYSKQLSILDFVVKSALPMFLKQRNSKDEPQPSTSSYCVSYMDGNNDTTEEVRSPPDEESHSKMIRCLHCPKDIPDIIKSHVSAGPSHQCSVPY